VNCAHCGTPIPAGSRRDRAYCNNNCSALASYFRRKNGAAPPPRWQHPAPGSADPVLRAATALARQLGETHGWSPSTLRCALDGLMVLLDGRPAGERVTLTEIRTRTSRHTSVPRVAEVLAGLDLLEEDSTPAVRSWIERRADALPRGFAGAVRAWLLVLLDGDARARPRSPASIYVYFAAVQPLIEQWSADRDHLREVITADITAVLDPLRGHQLRTTTVAVRSLFRFARKTRTGLRQPRRTAESRRPRRQPAADDRRRDPGRRTGRHQPRPAADRRPGRGPRRPLGRDPRPHPGRPRPAQPAHHHRRAPQRLGELTHRALRAWLDHRRATWPRTPNRHVLISAKTALGSGPVSRGFLAWNLQRHGVNIERIRRDRVLHEALTARADPLHLALVFCLSHATASKYTLMACDLLADQPAEAAEA